MNPTAIVLLIGVCSFWVAAGVFLALFLKLRSTLTSVEHTLDSVREEIEKLSPVLADTLEQVTSTGQEVERTVSEAKSILSGVRDHRGSTLISGAITAIPAAISAFKLLKPLFSKKKKQQQQ